VLVIGTTPDYVDLIASRWPGRAVFLTHPEVRAGASETPPPPGTEILCDLTAVGEAIELVADAGHIGGWRPSGVTAYDCESLYLAAQLAEELGFPFASPSAVAACRNKLASKRLWEAAGVPCPRAARVRTVDEALGFREEIAGPMVLKPLCGSGAELTFLCRTRQEVATAFGTLAAGLARHADERLLGSLPGDSEGNPREVFAAEEFVAGTEFSADFIVAEGRVSLLRTARKIPHPGATFGTTMAYVVPSGLSDPVMRGQLPSSLSAAACALGVRRGLCMADFILRDGLPVLLELTPRPGGDCLPDLLLHSGGLDTIGAALDLAEGLPVRAPSAQEWCPLVGLRLLAARSGALARIDVTGADDDERVVLCRATKAPGHRIILPPDDYDSRILGHILFRPAGEEDLVETCLELSARVRVSLEGEP